MKIRFSVSTNIVHYFHNLKMMNFNFEWNISQLLSWIYVLPSSKLWLIEEERQHQCSKNPSDKGRGSSLTTLPFYMMGVVMMKMVNFRNFFFHYYCPWSMELGRTPVKTHTTSNMMCNIVLAKSWQLSLDILFSIGKP